MHDAPSLSLIDVTDRYRFYSYNSLLANRCSSICFSTNFSLYFMRQVSLFGYFSHTSIIFNIFLWRFVIFFFFFFTWVSAAHFHCLRWFLLLLFMYLKYFTVFRDFFFFLHTVIFYSLLQIICCGLEFKNAHVYLLYPRAYTLTTKIKTTKLFKCLQNLFGFFGNRNL